MEIELQYQVQLDQDLEELLYPRGIQTYHSFLSEEETRAYTDIRFGSRGINNKKTSSRGINIYYGGC